MTPAVKAADAAMEAYFAAHGHGAVSGQQIVEWLWANGKWSRHKNEPLDAGVRRLEKLLPSVTFTDPQGRTVTKYHGVRDEPAEVAR